jgi:hypothetical protein
MARIPSMQGFRYFVLGEVPIEETNRAKNLWAKPKEYLASHWDHVSPNPYL